MLSKKNDKKKPEIYLRVKDKLVIYQFKDSRDIR